MNWTAIWVTCQLASLTSLALLVIGLPIAYWLTFSKWRWKFLIESIVALPLVLPRMAFSTNVPPTASSGTKPDGLTVPGGCVGSGALRPIAYPPVPIAMLLYVNMS